MFWLLMIYAESRKLSRKSPKFFATFRRALYAPLQSPNVHMYSNLAKSFRSLIFLCAFFATEKMLLFNISFSRCSSTLCCFCCLFCRGIKKLCIELFAIYVYMSLCYVFIPFQRKNHVILFMNSHVSALRL